MFKLKCDDFLIYDEATGRYSLSPEQQVRDETEKNKWKSTKVNLKTSGPFPPFRRMDVAQNFPANFHF